MKQVLKWNDAIYEICNVSTVRGDQGTVWRFDISGNQSLVVVPFEAKPFTMEEATAAPEYIFPTLAGLRGEGNMLGFLFREIVLGAAVGSDALKHIRQFIERFGMKKPAEKKVVKPFYDALLKLRGQSILPDHYAEILDELQTLTGGQIRAQDVKERLFLDFSPGMPNYLLELGNEVAEARGCSDIDALNFVLGSCPYCADYGNGTCRLLRSVKLVSLPKGFLKTPHEKKVSGERAKAARKNKKVTPDQERKIKDYYRSLRRPTDQKKKPESKRNAGILTNKWIRRAKESGGLGLSVEYSSKQIQRMAGDAK
jgi:hypothetical protein